MCGLYGFTTDKSKYMGLSQKKRATIGRIVTSLSLAMQERGTDSTGIAALGGERPVIFKRARAAREVSSKILRIASDKKHMLIGHTRTATIGAVTKENAHPFKRGSVIGAHNGSVSNYLTIDRTVNVDSEVIFSLLDKEKNDFDVFGKLSGRFAITWNYKNDQFATYLVRHSNPLFICKIKPLNSYFWCSTESALEAALVATLDSEDFINTKISEIDEDVVYRIGGSLRVTKRKTSFRQTTYNSGWFNGAVWKAGRWIKPEEEDANDKGQQSLLPAKTTTGYHPDNKNVETKKDPEFPHTVFDSSKNSSYKTPAFFGKEKEAIRALFAGCPKCHRKLIGQESAGAYWEPDSEEFLCFWCNIDRKVGGFDGNRYCTTTQLSKLANSLDA